MQSLIQDAPNVTLRSETLQETVSDAIIANGGVRKLSKMCKMPTMTDASNTLQILVVCAMQGIRFSSINCFAMRGNKRNGQPEEGICDTQHTVH